MHFWEGISRVPPGKEGGEKKGERKKGLSSSSSEDGMTDSEVEEK